ncbi:putative N-acetylmannosamine-6-phosphate 2-epimerase [Alloacidobacterium sp.]|uniref:N-acetylmannosamine-6-phosphate 2-epimerase n=1 Tax=Alloacidobacterium sp. TaxID=2951999 RepID=UPI002D53CD6F|nr:putative N-acetylmannosamine-6-phosphate 2-epimerase [Alloacidobacterium sp.]HYK35893.1 putative N-acetylmannosamine-6-phosphate 2-epimerase [Alloacidobacterium sp.]
MTTSGTFPASLKNKLIVSCQALPGDPLDDTDTLRRIAISVLRGGAGGLRANGHDCIAAFRRETSLPIIGILKQFEKGTPNITPDFASAKIVADAGADVIGVDCSAGRFPTAEPWPQLLSRIRQELRLPVLADIATLDDARAAEQTGADGVATTMFGYTPETAGQRSINWTLVEELVKFVHLPVIVEGHIHHPEEVRRAFDLGAFAVVVGAAITQPGAITTRFVAGIGGD